MAELRDIHGNPVQLTDEHGNPVKLTDEHGNPVHVSGVATTVPPGGAATTRVFGTDKATHGGRTVAEMIATEPRTSDRPVAVDQPKHHGREPGELRRSSSSSSSSSEDDGQGGRRKKNKGLQDKIKEKLPGGKQKNKEEQPHSTTASTTTTTATGGHHATTTTTHPDHEKKSIMEKIKEKLPGPVTIADQTAEESMVSILLESFPTHAIFGEEKGWRCKETSAEYIWVLDPIDGTKSFITGKPLFGTLIALLQNGRPILGIIDQPVLGERWIGISGKRTTLNGQEVSTRTCANLSQAYMYTTSPHLFSGDAEEAFIRVRSKVKIPLYGCDCYAYALLASGFVDLVVESGLKPYDFLALIPVIEGAGGVITDWKGDQLYWEASPLSPARSFNVVAAGDKKIHQQALDSLQWK